MPAIRIAVQLASLRLPFRRALSAAARLGIGAVEIDARDELRPQELGQTGVREVRRLLEEHELRVAAVSFRTRRGYDVADALDQRVAATKQAMRLAADLRADVLLNRVGTVPAAPEGRDWTTLVEALTDLGRHGQHLGVLLTAQTGSESGEDLARLCDALPPQSLGASLDPGSLIIHGFSPLEAVAALGARIVYVQARDGVRDLARGRGLEAPLGRGTADFPALLGALENYSYRGYFSIARGAGEDRASEIAAAVEYLKQIVR